VYSLRGAKLTEEAFISHVRQGRNRQNPLGGYFAYNAELDGRAGIYTSTAMYNILTDPPTAPLHYVFADPHLEADISDLAKRNFGATPTLNRLGNSLELYVGSTRETPMLDSVPNLRYIAAIK
jgi:hypothetical protein